MNWIKRIWCKNEVERLDYTAIPTEKLPAEKGRAFIAFRNHVMIWVAVGLTMILGANVDPEVLALLAVVILAVVINLWNQYKRKVRMIDRLLRMG